MEANIQLTEAITDKSNNQSDYSVKCPSCKKTNRSIAKHCRFCGNEIKIETPALVEKTDSNNKDLQDKDSDYIGLDGIKQRISQFIANREIFNEQKSAGLHLGEHTKVILFRGETGTGKSLVAEKFINQLLQSKCLETKRTYSIKAEELKRICEDKFAISKYLSENKYEILLIDQIQADENYLHEILLGLTDKPSKTICLLLGIKNPLDEYFKNHPEDTQMVSDFFDFPPIADENLCIILEKKLTEMGFEFDGSVKDGFMDCIQEAKVDSSCSYKNGWIVEKEILPKILNKQSERLSKKSDRSAEDLKHITTEDLPVNLKKQSPNEILEMLDEFIGMDSVKKAVRTWTQTIKNNQKRKALGLPTDELKLHILLTGNPGTGKTTVTRILGKLFKAMQLLPSDKVIETSGLDLTAGYVGQTKDKVNELCDSAMGGVLFIDEAYYLAGSESGNASSSFASEAVGTILKRMEDARGRFVVVAAGYQKEMQNFMKMNPGLESRFGTKIHIDDYSVDELYKILCQNVKKSQFVFTEEAEKNAYEAVDEICKNKGKDFANARAVRNLFDTIKLNMDERIEKIPENEKTKDLLTTILPDDIPHEDNKELSVEDVFEELNELVGMEKVKTAVRELYDTVKINSELETLGEKVKSPEIHIALTGNPGTGKTTVARILGKLFKTMGLISSDKVIECDRSTIVEKYVGHTAKKMQQLCDDATGKILFIDEVYALSSDDFGKEATDTLMKRMEDDRGKFIVVVAGYADKMDEWMAVNEGLSSRFTHRIHLDDYDENELYALFQLYAKKEGLLFTDEAGTLVQACIANIWQNRGSSFANGRTIRQLFDSIVRKKNSRVNRLSKSEHTKEILTTITKEDIPSEDSQ